MLIDTKPGAYGIEAVDPATPGSIICGTCGRAWVEDITPAGRCPWEDQHIEDEHDEELGEQAVVEETPEPMTLRDLAYNRVTLPGAIAAYELWADEQDAQDVPWQIHALAEAARAARDELATNG